LLYAKTYLAGVLRIAARRRRLAAFGVEALDGCGAGKYTVTTMAGDIHEKPGDGIGVR
jgi:hypothetical protein